MDFNTCCEFTETDIQNMDAEKLADVIDFLQHNLDTNPGLDILAKQAAHTTIGLCKRYLQGINLMREAELGDVFMGVK